MIKGWPDNPHDALNGRNNLMHRQHRQTKLSWTVVSADPVTEYSPPP
jgi:hypothetical protein